MVCMVVITESRRRRNEDICLFKAWRLERMVGCVQVVCRWCVVPMMGGRPGGQRGHCFIWVVQWADEEMGDCGWCLNRKAFLYLGDARRRRR